MSTVSARHLVDDAFIERARCTAEAQRGPTAAEDGWVVTGGRASLLRSAPFVAIGVASVVCAAVAVSRVSVFVPSTTAPSATPDQRLNPPTSSAALGALRVSAVHEPPANQFR